MHNTIIKKSKSAINAMVEGVLIKTILVNIKKSFSRLRAAIDLGIGIMVRQIICRKIPVDKNKIMFITYQNRYDCNLKYITDQILKENLPYKLVWAANREAMQTPGHFPDNVKVVRRNSIEYFREAASAKIWFDNAINYAWDYIPKKKGQIYFQTWHGSMGLKRIGKDDVKNRRWTIAARKCNKITDYCISNSEFETQVFKETHWPDVEILNYGHARNDILVQNSASSEAQDIENNVKMYFDIPRDNKILLYAPTFRDNGLLDAYNIDFKILHKTLEDTFGGNWTILIRLHFKAKKMASRLCKLPFTVNATTYSDMQELMICADIGITDYSSWICDFVLTKRPAFLYTPDLDNYENERGFYYPLKTTPFPMANTNSELVNNIKNFNIEVYQECVSKFLEERGCWEDGHAAEKIVLKIKEIIEV